MLRGRGGGAVLGGFGMCVCVEIRGVWPFCWWHWGVERWGVILGIWGVGEFRNYLLGVFYGVGGFFMFVEMWVVWVLWVWPFCFCCDVLDCREKIVCAIIWAWEITLNLGELSKFVRVFGNFEILPKL